MKSSLKLISLSILFQFTAVLSIAQCVLPDSTFYVPEGDNYYESRNGYFLPAHGTLRILLIFAEIEYDTLEDPVPPNGTIGWPAHSLPTWVDNLLDTCIPTGQPEGLMTRYYFEASSGHYIILPKIQTTG